MTDTAPRLAAALVGSTGFSYPEWRGAFYPADAAPEDFLRLYAGRLPAVELAVTAYRLPAEDQLRRWAEATPPAFRFAVRAPKAIGAGRLDRLGAFTERLAAFGDRLGPVVVRLPDDRPRDDGFVPLLLGSLPAGIELALDARHPSWDGVEPALDDAGAVRVGALEAAPPFRVLRLREPPYDDAALRREAARIRPLAAAGATVYAFVGRGAAPDHAPGGEPTAITAERLLRLLA